MNTIHLIAAARPNFMKIAPLYHALKKTDWCHPQVVYTGQHKDPAMSTELMRELGIAPCAHLGPPDAVVVPGDVRDARKAAVEYARNGVPVVHLEAGLRSGDTGMPEEVNRIVIDHLSDLLWASEPSGVENLRREECRGRVEEIGNIMIDSLAAHPPVVERKAPYAVLTLHRPSNVDNPRMWREIQAAANVLPIVFPVHPRTRQNPKTPARLRGVTMREPMGHAEFTALMAAAALVITDSGGIQEETTYLGVPCATLRENTERPATLAGTNRLVKPAELVQAARNALAGRWPRGVVPARWDGQTAARAVISLKQFLGV